MSQRTIYFKNRTPEEITAILSKAANLAQAFQVGTAADDLLAAIANGSVVLSAALTPTDPTTPPKLTLTQVLERSAARLDSIDPELAAELRKRLWLVTAAMG